MPRTCWAPGCKSGYKLKNKPPEKRHFFRAPQDSTRLNIWKKRIPREGDLTPKHCLCDVHFEDRFIIKTYRYVINGEVVELDRGKWELTKDAEPTIFPNLPKYLNIKLPRPHNPKRRRSAVEDTTVSGKSCSNITPVKCENIADDSVTSHQETIPASYSNITPMKCENIADDFVTSHQETIPASLPTSCSKCKVNRLLNSQIYLQNRRLRRLVARTQQLESRLQKLSAENERMRLKMTEFQQLQPRKTRKKHQH